MTRAYVRLDPNLPEHKGDYPDGAGFAFVMCLCLAEEQPKRGRFKSERLLRVLLEKRGRWVPYLIEHEDLIVQQDGSLYVDGWDEWQEGDWKVSERINRVKNRKTVRNPTNGTVKNATNGTVLARAAEAEAVSGGIHSGGGAPYHGDASPDDSPPKTREELIAEQRRLLSHPHPAIAQAAAKALRKLGQPA
jgi:hypothetical protein